MKKTLAVCVFILILSLFSASCGNFSSADSYLGGVYSRPESLIKSDADESDKADNTVEESFEYQTAEEITAEDSTANETEASTEAEEERGDAIFVITESGKRFHVKDCRTALSVKKFVSYDEGISLGYEPCRICNPQKD